MWKNRDKFITLEIRYELGTDRARGTTTLYTFQREIGDF